MVFIVKHCRNEHRCRRPGPAGEADGLDPIAIGQAEIDNKEIERLRGDGSRRLGKRRALRHNFHVRHLRQSDNGGLTPEFLIINDDDFHDSTR